MMHGGGDDPVSADEKADWPAEVDEYLWPLTGEAAPIDWTLLTEELRVRQRLLEIMAHVREMHIEPRVRRAGASPSTALGSAIAASIVAGRPDAPPWEQVLLAPVPRALRDEWAELAQRLRAIGVSRERRAASAG
jgi:hypothetical protein